VTVTCNSLPKYELTNTAIIPLVVTATCDSLPKYELTNTAIIPLVVTASCEYLPKYELTNTAIICCRLPQYPHLSTGKKLKSSDP